MLRKHRNTLNDYRVYLLKHFNLTEEVFCLLRSHKDKIITEVLEDEIKSKPKSQQPGLFLDILTKRGPSAFEAFLHALLETNQQDVISKLDPSFFQKTDLAPKDLIKTRTGYEKSNLPIDMRSTKTDDTVESTSHIHATYINQIVEAIRTKISHPEVAIENENMPKHGTNCFNGSSRLYMAKTKSELIDGFDYSHSDYLAKEFLGNISSPSDYLLSENSDLFNFGRIIAADCKALSNVLVLIAAEITNGGELKLEDISEPLPSFLLKILKPIKLSETNTVIMLSLYGSGIDDATILGEEITAKIQSGKLVIINHKMLNFEPKYKNWNLCLMLECLRSLTAANPEGFDIKKLLSLISEVGKISKQEEIISDFAILYNENLF